MARCRQMSEGTRGRSGDTEEEQEEQEQQSSRSRAGGYLRAGMTRRRITVPLIDKGTQNGGADSSCNHSTSPKTGLF